MDLYKKYIKYKSKYFDLKDQNGGNPSTPLRFFNDTIEESYNTYQSPQDFVFDMIVVQHEYQNAPKKKVSAISRIKEGEEYPKLKLDFDSLVNPGKRAPDTSSDPDTTQKSKIIKYQRKNESRKEIFKELGNFNPEKNTTDIVGINQFTDKYSDLLTKNGGGWCRESVWTNEKVATMNASGIVNFLWPVETYEEEEYIKQKFYDKINKDNENGVILLKYLNKDIIDKINIDTTLLKKDRYEIIGSKNRSNKIIYIAIFGLDDHETKRPIRDDIKKYYQTIPCVVCGSKANLVCDHKNDLYNDPRVLDTKTQDYNDFQSLCNHCNLVKRQISKDTKNTKKRYSAKNIPTLNIFNIDYISGDENLKGYYNINGKFIYSIDAMVGTYWYDPIAFINYIKNMDKP